MLKFPVFLIVLINSLSLGYSSTDLDLKASEQVAQSAKVLRGVHSHIILGRVKGKALDQKILLVGSNSGKLEVETSLAVLNALSEKPLTVYKALFSVATISASLCGIFTADRRFPINGGNPVFFDPNAGKFMKALGAFYAFALSTSWTALDSYISDEDSAQHLFFWWLPAREANRKRIHFSSKLIEQEISTQTSFVAIVRENLIDEIAQYFVRTQMFRIQSRQIRERPL